MPGLNDTTQFTYFSSGLLRCSSSTSSMLARIHVRKTTGGGSPSKLFHPPDNNCLFLFLDTTNGERNRLHLPAGVDFTVSVAQIIGLLFTVIIMVQDGDICAGLAQLVEGYEKDIMLNSPNATHLRWYLSRCRCQSRSFAKRL